MPTDDEEEVDQGHYDVISRHQAKRNNSLLAAASSTKPSLIATATNGTTKTASGGNSGAKSKKPKNHPYEKVKDFNGQEGDSDSATYAGASCDPTYAAVSEKSSEYDPMYVGVKEGSISSSTYAGVKESQSESSLGETLVLGKYCCAIIVICEAFLWSCFGCKTLKMIEKLFISNNILLSSSF